MRFIARTILVDAALACSAVVAFAGCEARSHQTKQVSADDKRIASETIEHVKLQVASSGELTRRYGDFVSMEIRSVRRLPPFDAFDVHEPEQLLIDCLARFEKFSTRISVHVFDSAVFKLSMKPTEEHLNSQSLIYKPVQDGDELWFVRQGPYKGGVQSIVSCQTSHPDFEP